jgi:hypothetical protein
MSDEHFSRETLERFFRSELGEMETQSLVRHLLRQCPQCTPVLREVAQSRNFRHLMLQGGVADACAEGGVRGALELREEMGTGTGPRIAAGVMRMLRRA